MVMSVQYVARVCRTTAVADCVVGHGHEVSELGRWGGGREFAFCLIPKTSLPPNFHCKIMK